MPDRTISSPNWSLDRLIAYICQSDLSQQRETSGVVSAHSAIRGSLLSMADTPYRARENKSSTIFLSRQIDIERSVLTSYLHLQSIINEYFKLSRDISQVIPSHTLQAVSNLIKLVLNVIA